MSYSNEIKTVFIGDIAFNTDITPFATKTSIGGAAYYSAVGAIAGGRVLRADTGVGIVAPVGEDFDLQYLKQKGIDTTGTPVIPGEETCRFTLTQHPDNTREFSANRNVAEIPRLDLFPHHYLDAQHIHLATSLPQSYLAWIKYLSGKTNAVISADAFEVFAIQFPQETIQALNMSRLIFINEAEANILEKKGSITRSVPWIFKRGAGGASYIANDREISVKAKPVQAIETTGAGDVLAGAFLTLLSRNLEPEEALTHAVNLATLSVTQFGVEHLLT